MSTSVNSEMNDNRSLDAYLSRSPYIRASMTVAMREGNQIEYVSLQMHEEEYMESRHGRRGIQAFFFSLRDLVVVWLRLFDRLSLHRDATTQHRQ